jgi:hypothetical protein
MDEKMSKEINDIPLSESNVSLKLADIQKRCSQLIESNDGMLELALEEYNPESDNNNPYNHG